MKKLTTTIALAFCCLLAKAQTNSFFLRHDTTIINSSEANWLVPPSQKTSLNNGEDQTVSEWFLSAIRKGKLKAVDPESGQPIPAKDIYHWQMPSDTAAVWDVNGDNMQYKILQEELDPSSVDRIRVQQDWWMDIATGKIFTRIRWIELMRKIYSPSGDWRGYRPLCRINY